MTNQQINILKESLLLIEQQELETLKNLTTEKITPSPAYCKNMERLIQKEKSWRWSLVKTKNRRLLTIIIAALLIFSSIFSVSAIREPTIEYVKSVYEEFTHFFFGDEELHPANIIETEYTVKWLPNNYTIKSTVKSPGNIRYQWTFGTNYIIFNQTIIGVDSIHLNTEQNAVSILEIGNQLYYYNNFHGNYFIIWTTDDYAFHLSCSESIGWDNILKMLESVEPA